jgi:hypothetical protein
MKGAERQTMMLQERAQHDRSILRRVVQCADHLAIVKSYGNTIT